MSDLTRAYRSRASGPQKEYAKLAEVHLEHDLTQQDRELLEKAAGKISFHVTAGSIIGLGLGVALAFRMRSSAIKFINVLQKTERPTHIQYADGRAVPFPDVSALYHLPPPGSNALTAFLFGTAGLFLGGELGMVTGTRSAKRTLNQDLTSRRRIEAAFRKFKADVLRKQAQELEAGTGELDF